MKDLNSVLLEGTVLSVADDVWMDVSREMQMSVTLHIKIEYRTAVGTSESAIFAVVTYEELAVKCSKIEDGVRVRINGCMRMDKGVIVLVADHVNVVNSDGGSNDES